MFTYDWFAATHRMGRCDRCKEKPISVAWIPDPYLLVMYNDHIEGWFCTGCYDERKQEIEE